MKTLSDLIIEQCDYIEFLRRLLEDVGVTIIETKDDIIIVKKSSYIGINTVIRMHNDKVDSLISLISKLPQFAQDQILKPQKIVVYMKEDSIDVKVLEEEIHSGNIHDMIRLIGSDYGI